MEYEKLKEEIRERMQERLGAGTEVSFRSLKRNNGAETEGLEVREKGIAAAPVLHLDDLYGNYCGNDSMEETVSSALKMLEEKPPVDIGEESYNIQPIAKLLGWMAGIPAGAMRELPEEMTKQFVLSNESCRYGAAGVLRKDLMERFAEQVGGNFYILPSSIHDLILLPDDGFVSSECLKEMVQEVNKSVVAREEWLSENVYYYDCKEKKVRISNTEKK